MSNNPFDLKGKNIVVCGGAGLIGGACSMLLHDCGATVWALDINSDRLAGLVSQHQGSDRLHQRTMDATDPRLVKTFITETFSNARPLHGWINAAYPRTADWGVRYEEVKAESLEKNVSTQMNSVFLICQSVAETMKAQGVKGSIVNFGSTYGVVAPYFPMYENTTPTTSPAAYSMIKGGTLHFCKYLAAYYGPYNIRVNAISPGGVYDGHSEVFHQRYKERTPLCRMGRPEEIAGPVAFLCSDASSYVTGHNLVADGGYTIW